MKASTVLESLLGVKEAALVEEKPTWFNSKQGICGNVDGYEIIMLGVSEYYSSNCLEYFYPQWSEWSGCETFPVPSTIKAYTAEDMYMEHRGNMWTGEYSAARLRLLDYLIQRVEALGDSEISFGEE